VNSLVRSVTQQLLCMSTGQTVIMLTKVGKVGV